MDKPELEAIRLLESRRAVWRTAAPGDGLRRLAILIRLCGKPYQLDQALRDELTGKLRGAFHQLAERWAVPEHHRHLLSGVPAKAMTEFAAHETMDVVMMGTLTHRGLGKVLSSTAEQLPYKVPAIIAIHPAA